MVEALDSDEHRPGAVSRRSAQRALRRVGWLAAVAVLLAAAYSASQASSGQEPATTTAAVAASAPVKPIAFVGDLDGATETAEGVEVFGWVVASDPGAPLPRVDITAGADVVAQVEPTHTRIDVAAAYGTAQNIAGFSARLEPGLAAHTVCADARRTSSSPAVRLGCTRVDRTVARESKAQLDKLVERLGRTAEQRLTGVTAGVAVVPFDTGEVSGWRENRLFISASAAKAWWTAAALDNGQRNAAADAATAVFTVSSDSAAGTMIDLAGGIDAVNAFTTRSRMPDTAAIKWNSGGKPRRSELFPGRKAGSNYVDPSDAATFFYQLGTNQILPPALTEQLATWMRLSPRDSRTGDREASTIPDALPAKVKAGVEQKAGWLRPGDYSVPGHLLGVGIVHPTNGGPSYAIALMSAGGDRTTHRRVIEFFQSASCQIYKHVSGHSRWSCPTW
ncbi:MAG: serine hydrolase [Acidimicrobiales bacterium]